MKLLEENVRVTLQDIDIGDDFLDKKHKDDFLDKSKSKQMEIYQTQKLLHSNRNDQ